MCSLNYSHHCKDLKAIEILPYLIKAGLFLKKPAAYFLAITNDFLIFTPLKKQPKHKQK